MDQQHHMHQIHTTSAIFNIGTTSFLKKIITSKEIQSACHVMADISASLLSIHNAGRDIFKILYGCYVNISLNEFRYKNYMQSLADRQRNFIWLLREHFSE